MLCAKCQKSQATVHFTTIVDGETEETIHLCEDCAPGVTGLQSLDAKEIEVPSVVCARCEFCGEEAFSEATVTGGGGIYWCFDCAKEFGRIMRELIVSERPELFQRSGGESSLHSLLCDPELRVWLGAVNRKAMEMLKEKKKQE
jgi:protein-arginine kinase activator protein McsA